MCRDLLTSLVNDFKKSEKGDDNMNVDNEMNNVQNDNKKNEDMVKKNKLLESNNDLMNLYQQLVTTGILTAEEFWDRRMDMLEKEGKIGISEKQKQGISSSSVFSDNLNIENVNDNDDKIEINLTKEKVLKIFVENPQR